MNGVTERAFTLQSYSGMGGDSSRRRFSRPMSTPRLTLALATATLAACGGPPAAPEEALRAWVASAERAAENRDLDAMLELVSADYADARGNDRDDVARTLRLWFLRQKSIGLIVDIADIELFRDTAANVSLTVGMAGVNDSTFGFSADAYRFELELIRDDAWQLVAARWGQVGEEPR